jgi:hypothetical protein
MAATCVFGPFAVNVIVLCIQITMDTAGICIAAQTLTTHLFLTTTLKNVFAKLKLDRKAKLFFFIGKN